jgi:hypothetical protein
VPVGLMHAHLSASAFCLPLGECVAWQSVGGLWVGLQLQRCAELEPHHAYKQLC